MKVPVFIPIANETNLKFNCTQCGLCCKAIGCPHLTEDNLCSIYETRPLVCNIEQGYQELFKDKMTKREWFMLNEHYCKVLQAQEK
jgi:Fe-S-cluster containining protein